MAIKNHRLSRLIHGTPTIGYGRRTRNRRQERQRLRRQKRRRRRHQIDIFTGSGFNRYGALDDDVAGWDKERIDRLLDRDIPEHELSLPNEPRPRLTAGYLSRRLSCLPTGLYKNLLRQNLTRTAPRIESYFVHQYGEVPPRVRRLLTGSYHGSFFQAPPFAHRLKAENEPLDQREYRRYRHRIRHPLPLRPPPPAPPPPARPTPHPTPSQAPPSNTASSMFNFGGFSPLSVSSSAVHNLDNVLDTLMDGDIQEEYPYIPTTPPVLDSPPFQILPLTSNEPPPATLVEAVQKSKISNAEKSAEDLETILNVAGSSIRSIISNLQAPSPPIPPPAALSSYDMWKQMQEALHEELENPDDDINMFDTSKRVMQHEQMAATNDSSNISTENLYDDLLEHNNSPLFSKPATPPPPPPPRITGYIPHKRMPSTPPLVASSPRITGYVAHKQMPPSPQQLSVATSPIPQPRMKHYGTQMTPPPHQHRRRREYGTQMDHDIRTHNKIRSIFEDFCKGKTNTRHTTHRIMDIAHQVAKDNIR